MQTKVHRDGGAFSPWEGVDGALVINMDSGMGSFSQIVGNQEDCKNGLPGSRKCKKCRRNHKNACSVIDYA